MVKGLESIMLGSEDASKLANFYQDKVGIKIKEEYEMGEDDSAFEMEIGEGSGFMINSHSEVNGMSKEPQRLLLNFEVASIDEAVSDLDNKGVKKVTDKYHIEGYGYIATYQDVDGNYFQIVQTQEG